MKKIRTLKEKFKIARELVNVLHTESLKNLINRKKKSKRKEVLLLTYTLQIGGHF